MTLTSAKLGDYIRVVNAFTCDLHSIGFECSSQDFFQRGGIFNPLHLHAKKVYFESFNPFVRARLSGGPPSETQKKFKNP
jgi:hypothetical protein